MADDEDDKQLAESAAAGELEAFRKLIERHRENVYRFAYHLLRDPHGAEDVAQEVFVKAFQRITTFSPHRGAFKGWLLTITKNTCWDAIEQRTRDFPTDLSRRRLPEAWESDSAVESREIFRILDTALDELPEPFRSTFLLSEIEELPLREIAEIENIPIGTVKSRINRAREKLQARLKPLLEKS